MEISMPKISVIMGIYNVEKTLAEALDSILIQSFQDFEIIMCDDSSTDETISIALKYKERFPNKIVLLSNNRNMGLNYTLNYCLQYVSGTYVARMDGDDICVPTRFEKQVQFLDNHPEFGFVSSSMIYFDEDGEFKVSKMITEPSIRDLVKGRMFCHAPVMIRTEAYKAVEGYTVDKRMLRVEDVDLWFKLYAHGYKGYNLQEPLYKMRDDRNAIKRRKFRYRINSTFTRIVGYRRLSVPFYMYPYALKPIIVGLVPMPFYVVLHRMSNKQDSLEERND